MSIRLIALDLDGTTLNSQGKVSEYTRKILCEAADRGIIIMIASGRPFSGLPLDVLDIPAIRYAITGNGSSIFEIKGGRRVAGTYMKEATISSVLEIIEDTVFTFEAFSNGVGYTNQAYYDDPESFGVPARVKAYLEFARTPVPSVSDVVRTHMDQIEGLNLIVADPAEKERLIRKLEAVPDLYLTAAMSYYIEMADKSVSKAATLKGFADSLGIEREEIMAFGDASNDLELLSFAGTGVAMTGSEPCILEIADAVTLSNDEDGVAYYIQKTCL